MEYRMKYHSPLSLYQCHTATTTNYQQPAKAEKENVKFLITRARPHATKTTFSWSPLFLSLLKTKSAFRVVAAVKFELMGENEKNMATGIELCVVCLLVPLLQVI